MTENLDLFQRIIENDDDFVGYVGYGIHIQRKRAYENEGAVNLDNYDSFVNVDDLRTAAQKIINNAFEALYREDLEKTGSKLKNDMIVKRFEDIQSTLRNQKFPWASSIYTSALGTILFSAMLFALAAIFGGKLGAILEIFK